MGKTFYRHTLITCRTIAGFQTRSNVTNDHHDVLILNSAIREQMNAKTGGRVRYSAQWSSDIQVKGTIGREGLCTATVMQIPSKGFAHLRSHRSPGRSWGGESGSLRAGDPERPADPQSQPAPSQSPWSPTESCFWERGQSRVTTMRRPPTRSDTPAVQSEISSMTLHYNTKWQSELRVILGKITHNTQSMLLGINPRVVLGEMPEVSVRMVSKKRIPPLWITCCGIRHRRAQYWWRPGN